MATTVQYKRFNKLPETNIKVLNEQYNKSKKLQQEAFTNAVNDRVSKYKDYRLSELELVPTRARMLDEFSNYYKKELMYGILESIYFDSIPIDTHEKLKKKSYIKNVMREHLDSIGDYRTVSKKLSEANSYLRNFVEYAEGKAIEATMSKKPKVDDAKRIEDIKDILYSDNDIDIDIPKTDDISTVIKDKVIKVINDEKEMADKEKAMRDEIETAAGNGEDVSIQPLNDVEESTLFRSLMINYSSKILKEANKSDDLRTNPYILIDESGIVSINNEAVLAESVITYTLLETLHTLNIERVTEYDVRVMSHKLLGI